VDVNEYNTFLLDVAMKRKNCQQHAQKCYPKIWRLK